MCGITGAIWTDDAVAVDAASLRRMTDLLRHRGPDDSGFYCSDLHLGGLHDVPGVALGHRRLAVIDLFGSRQPITNEDGSIHLVFNGEIYNYRDLRRRLEGSGHTFRTEGDTETLVHLYEDEGTDFLRHLNGMFALALWDAPRRRLVLARDRLGQKPLVYRQERNRLIFASELKSLLAAPGVPRTLDPNAIDEYLTYQYVPHPNTIFAGTRKLPPGHFAVFEDRTLTVRSYWQPDLNYEFAAPDAYYVKTLRERLTSAVALRMQSDVPIGAFLSGGVDSSLIVALMQQLADRPIKTFSIGFSQSDYDETYYARAVAEHLGTQHHEMVVQPADEDLLTRLVWHYDEPLADSSALPTFLLSQWTREHVTVALSGDGGDELWAGYPRYQAVRLGAWIDRLPSAARAMLASRWWQGLPGSGRQKSTLRRWKRFCDALALSPQRRYGDWIGIFNESRRAALYRDEFLAQLTDSDPLGFLAAAFERSGQRDRVTSTALTDLLTYLPCDLLTKVDIASMAHGLECRQPLLDHAVVELAAAMPIRLKLRGWRGKRILRMAFGELLPRSIFRRRKMGFGVPLEYWFRGALEPFTRDLLLDRRATQRGYFRPEAVRSLLDEHNRGQFNHAARIWSLVIFELWNRQWVDDNPATPAGNHDQVISSS